MVVHEAVGMAEPVEAFDHLRQGFEKQLFDFQSGQFDQLGDLRREAAHKRRELLR